MNWRLAQLRPSRFSRAKWVLSALTILGHNVPTADAALLKPTRLGGAQAQGPATRSVTAIHHNPAVLAILPGFQVNATMATGLDHQVVRRFPTDHSGRPQPGLLTRQHLLNPTGNYFVGGSFLLDSVAIGAAYYSLNERFRIQSNRSLQYQLKTDPHLGCEWKTNTPCPNWPRHGGSVQLQTDFALSLALHTLEKFNFGVSFHFPRLHSSLGRNEDRRLLSHDMKSEGCNPESNEAVEDPRCVKHFSFRTRTRRRWLGLNPNPSSRLDFAISLGLAIELSDDLIFGFRYQTPPLLEGGTITLHGQARVCLPGEEHDKNDPRHCDRSRPIGATLQQQLPQEASLGISYKWGPKQRWKLDTNFYWIDRCPGKKQGCKDRSNQQLTFTGQHFDPAHPPQMVLYRGYQDVYGVELWLAYHLWKTEAKIAKLRPLRSRTSLLVGTSANTPGVSLNAITVTENAGWTLSSTIGFDFELLRGSTLLSIIPGYGFDLILPVRIGPGGRPPAYRPEDALKFEQSNGDINPDAADTVLQGRGRPTNAGSYFGAVHTLSLSVRWGERPR